MWALGETPLDYEVLYVLPFDSTRKCMSIILRDPSTDEIIMFCKGADSTILSKLAPIGKFVFKFFFLNLFL